MNQRKKNWVYFKINLGFESFWYAKQEMFFAKHVDSNNNFMMGVLFYYVNHLHNYIRS